jgi:GTPase
MFIDRSTLEVKAGTGGNGAISFLNLKYMEFGGPDGGGGGRGGSVYFEATKSMTTLLNFRFMRKIFAHDGENGKSKNRYGRSAEDVTVLVPVGTVVYDADTKAILADLNEEGQRALICKGGRGGRGNESFKTSVNRTPKIAQNGDLGEKRTILLELKLLADIGLVGFPSVGKSTFLSIISNAKPEIADYEFTTLVPNLGVVKLDGAQPFVVADLPGLIEGASQGKGLGLHFLRHLERCRVIIHMVDIASQRDPVQAFQAINEELKAYHPKLLTRPMVVAVTKMDAMENPDALNRFKAAMPNYEIFPISALTHEGVDALLWRAYQLLQDHAHIPLEEPVKQEKVYTQQDQEPLFYIDRPKNDTFIIHGKRIESEYRKMNLSSDEGVLRLMDYLHKNQVEDALIAKGVKNGDTVKLLDFEFTYHAN